jgi:DTW domain-containing protein YfiP
MPRSVCPRCNRIAVVCICSCLPSSPLSIGTPVFILQVPIPRAAPRSHHRPQRLSHSPQNRRENKRKTNSVSLLRLCLSPSSLHVISGCHPGRSLLETSPAYIAACEDGRIPLLLYPRAGALSEAEVAERAKTGARYSLVVLDGNWTETSEISRTLHDIASFALDVGKYKGLFSVRRPKQDGFLCTLEAVAYALDVIEPQPASPQLLPPMLRVCLQEEEFAVQRAGGVRHRPDAPGYRAGLMDDVRAAAAAYTGSAKEM